MMKNRCLNPASHDYKYYGARGITVCARWMKFENFIADMGERKSGYSIERRDNDGNYCPENCEWIPKNQQQRNRRKPCKTITIK